MRYLSVCSGIEAATVAWHPLGWTPVAFSEIEPFPAAVLAHHYPNVPNYGDMTKHKEWPLEPGSIDLLVGGTPCQAFSVAGLRRGLSDPRGGLMLTYLEIAQRLRPRWIVWENVPGVLSSGGGRDFGAFLGALGELGYGWAYRVLDAQWVRTQRHPRAVPQRRRRVFVVGCLGDGQRAAQVLFERESVQRDPAPRRAPGQGAAADAEAGTRAGCCYGGADANCSDTVTSKWSKGSGGPSRNECGLFLAQPTWPAEVAPTLNQSARGTGAPGYSNQELFAQGAGCLVPQPVPYDLFQITAPVNRQNRKPGDPCHTLARDNAAHAAVAFDWQSGGDSRGLDPKDTAQLQRCQTPAVAFTRCDNGQDASVEVTPTMRCGSNYSAHPAVAFTPGNLTRGAGPSPNAEVAPTQRCSAGRGADDQRTCVAFPIDGRNAMRDPDKLDEMNRQGMGIGDTGDPSHTVTTACVHGVAHAAVACPTLTAHNDPSRSPQSSEVTQQVAAVHAASMTVRRLTARECERLQAFPDDYTLIPWRKKPAAECPDGPRYKALGNSMAVNCMAWIGERIAFVEARHD